MNDMSNKWIGARTIRPDGADKVTGRATYSADNTMPGMIWGKVLRSPHAHAVIKSIDTSKADTGSSQTISLGSTIRARAMPMRWRCPPENSWG